MGSRRPVVSKSLAEDKPEVLERGVATSGAVHRRLGLLDWLDLDPGKERFLCDQTMPSGTRWEHGDHVPANSQRM